MPEKPVARRARKAPSPKAQALGLLAQREPSEVELRRKLLRRLQAARRATAAAAQATGEAPVDDDAAPVDDAVRVDDTIAWLRSHNYLSDIRFAESRVHARAARYGNLRIR